MTKDETKNAAHRDVSLRIARVYESVSSLICFISARK